MAKSEYFSSASFRFLSELAVNNNREWFTDNKTRYERDIKVPALRLITDFAGYLADLSPHFEATPRSLFRIHRDTRFSPDKRPYKTHAGIHFRHRDAKSVYAPGYYLHLEPGGVFAGFGIWHPEADTLRAIRDHIIEKPQAWKKASRGKEFLETFATEGERLSRPPKGYDPAHPLIEDLKLKDFVAMKKLPESFVCDPELPASLAKLWGTGGGYMRFLCEAVGAEFVA